MEHKVKRRSVMGHRRADSAANMLSPAYMSSAIALSRIRLHVFWPILLTEKSVGIYLVEYSR